MMPEFSNEPLIAVDFGRELAASCGARCEFGGVVGDITGRNVARAAGSAGRQLSEASMKAGKQFDRRMQPFAQGGGSAFDALMFAMGLPVPGAAAAATAGAPATPPQFFDYGQGGRAGDDPNDSGSPWGQTAAEQLAAWHQANPPGAGPAPYQPPGGLEQGELLQNFSLADFQTDPGYAFRLGEGEKSINRASGFRGSPYSGATLKALQRWGQDYASDEFGRAEGRYQTNRNFKFNSLFDLSKFGRNSSAMGGQAMIDAITGSANARAAGAMGSATAKAEGTGNIIDLIAQFFSGGQANFGGGSGGSRKQSGGALQGFDF